MSSINLFPTFHYSQPEDYHFSHDSVFLARRVFEFLQKHSMTPISILDLCAGCGVIGLDLLFHLRANQCLVPSFFDFIDVQASYAVHFEENLRRLGSIQTQCRFINRNYSDQSAGEPEVKYDLIVCNPPYFSKDQGKWPASDLKLRSRFFVDSDLPNLIQFLFQKLAPAGSAFVLIRNHLDHGKNQSDRLETLCNGKLKVVWMDAIRGTDVVRLTQNPDQ